MFKKYLQIALRSFRKNKANTAINILGLAVGISASLVIFLIVRYDLSFDKWEPQKDQIYRVYTKYGELGTNNGISLLAPEAIGQNVTGINDLAHICDAGIFNYAQIKDAPDQKIVTKWGSTVFADQNYFHLFPYEWIVGNPEVLTQLNTIVLAKSEVGKFFPGSAFNDVIGRVITFDDSINLTVRGVIMDLKQHSDFEYKNFISLKTFSETSLKNNYGTISWASVNSASQCFIRLDQGVNPFTVNQQIRELYIKNTKSFESKYRQLGTLQPLSDIHFNTKMDGSVSKASLLNLGVMALLLLVLAAINFINLSTAQSSLRAREIGVRKTFGSNNLKIVYQFLTETFVLTVLATLLAILLAPFLLHVFSGFVPDGLGTKEMLSPMTVLFLLITVAAVTVLAGLYPAFVLTRYKPVAAMKNQISKEGRSNGAVLRKILTVSQFVIAQVFLIIVVVIGKQIHFMMNKDLGFRKDAIISFFIPDGFTLRANGHKSALFNDLKSMSQVRDLSIASGAPTINGFNTNTVSWMKDGKTEDLNNVHTRSVDDNYLSVFDLKLVAGRNIHVDTARRTGEVMINQTLMHKMGIDNPEKIIGQYLMGGGGDSSVIVGVLKDFSTQNLHNPISPTTIFADDRSYGYKMSVLLDPRQSGNWPATIEAIEKKFKVYYPKTDFDYSFYDENLAKLYNADRRIATLLKWATGLAIFISCLGLLGLVSFMANQRKKEIGVRKVLGASVASIITLLSQSLIKLVLLASVIAFPFAWYFSHKWLQGFAFKTQIGWMIFGLCTAGMLGIALFVLWLRTFKSARANPILSLRDE